MADFDIKRNDLMPSIQSTLGGLPGTGLSTAIGVTFIMRKVGSVGSPKVDSAAVVVDAEAGIVRYDWKPGDTDESGNYQAEWEVMWPGNKPQTFPTRAYHTIDILVDLDTVVI